MIIYIGCNKRLEMTGKCIFWCQLFILDTFQIMRYRRIIHSFFSFKNSFFFVPFHQKSIIHYSLFRIL
jgi:hypothetical protein